ncbi:hypothetical protein predicted by Glimmer/Critica [Sorangium cellulosum So ce56]|uniref:Peptidase C51 domain-containing protein n=1 Tax=Sorangium cellulosum (strain So ce56) TaxID=448385 RepID=A9GVR1_SORC5|nr:hypothetical protein [Sorangium cellulosum]CAN93828.1 hypothetical protein predicted by Glimmer/Critica [Sorangium cellulosum So ce56]
MFFFVKRSRLFGIAMSFTVLFGLSGCVVDREPSDAAELAGVEQIDDAEQALTTCPYKSYLCGNDGINGDRDTLYYCSGQGATPSSPQRCQYGCTIVPGANDKCNPPPAGTTLTICPYRSYLCGNDGINGDRDTLYYCSGQGATPSSPQRCQYGCTIVPGANDRCDPPPASGTTLRASQGVLDVMDRGNYSGALLLWDDAGALKGGNQLPLKPTPVANSTAVKHTRVTGSSGVGWCTDFVRAAAGSSASTTRWQKGPRVVENSVPKGTVVATFSDGTHYSGHTGVLASASSPGATSIVLYDQNFSSPYDYLMRKHSLSRTDSGSVSDAAAYYVVVVAP